MPVTVTPSPHELVLVTDDGKQLYLTELVRSIGREESLDEAAVRLKLTLHAPSHQELRAYLLGSQGLILNGTPFGGTDPGTLWQGVVWDVQRSLGGAPSLPVTAYDHLIYAAKNEDDWFYEHGQTATAIIRESAARWSIPLGTLAETGVALKRQVQRGATLWRLWTDALRETAKNGGGLYRIRMNEGKLELVQLGANTSVWLLEVGENVMSLSESWSRDAVVTRAKIVGQATSDEAPRSVLAVHSDTALIKSHGTIQRVLSDPDVTEAAGAMELGRNAVRGPEESISLEAPDINTIRAGDAVVLRDETGTDYRLIADQVEHDGTTDPGKMRLTLATLQHIRWRWIIS